MYRPEKIPSVGDFIYNHLGMKAPEAVQNEVIGELYLKISLELLNDYAGGDYIL